LVILAALAPAPASAAHVFELNTGREHSDGNARAWGTVRFSDGGHRVNVAGKVNDMCPGDSYGAYFSATALLANGKRMSVGSAKEIDGCKGGGTFFDETNRFNSKIRWVTVEVVKYDQETMHQSGRDWAWIMRE
jgi:hypothetical protein